MSNLWSNNNPAEFWLCEPPIPQDIWHTAIRNACPQVGLPTDSDNSALLMQDILGEGQFGPDHWQLSSARRFYYELKPLLPHRFTWFLRRLYNRHSPSKFALNWPIEDRYVHFLWETLRQVFKLCGNEKLTIRYFWPEGQQFAFVLTHDIETASGQAYAEAVADLDESFGYRSVFNFVPERYPLDRDLIDNLMSRGFEIGIHGLRHDGKLFKSRSEFSRRAERINSYLQAFGASGFRAPYTHRQPEWMQTLNIEYDSSFFDTDPYEPIPGGTMSIWPFVLGHFVELPYTLVQDGTLTSILKETTPHIWLKKVDFIERYHGMALMLTHPDYLKDNITRKIYTDFLQNMKNRCGYWHALPRDIARWWRMRPVQAPLATATLMDNRIVISNET